MVILKGSPKVYSPPLPEFEGMATGPNFCSQKQLISKFCTNSYTKLRFRTSAPSSNSLKILYRLISTEIVLNISAFIVGYWYNYKPNFCHLTHSLREIKVRSYSDSIQTFDLHIEPLKLISGLKPFLFVKCSSEKTHKSA